MRKVGLLLLVLVLVNLPWINEGRLDRQLRDHGRVVAATVLDARSRDGRHYVDYRLPPRYDRHRVRYSTEVDTTTYELAQQSRTLPVRVVPGAPGTNRPEGVVRSSVYVVVAVLGDVVGLAIALLWWRRRVRWFRLVVLESGDGLVRLRGSVGDLTAAAPAEWVARLVAGRRVTGRFHVVADEDLVPGLPVDGFEQLRGAAYVVHGRVVDTRRGWVELLMADGFRLRVETGPHRVTADIRDTTGVRGTLCFTPTPFV